MPLKINQNKKCENITSILSQSFLSPNDCFRLMIEFRKLTEKNGNSDHENYPMISLYSDIAVHSLLDRRRVKSILNQIEKQFHVPEYEQSTNDLIADLFSIKTLQNEILSFQNKIPQIKIFSAKKIWVQFVGTFLPTILDTPLLQKDVLSPIENMYLKAVDMDENGNIRLPSHDPSIVWVIQCRQKDVQIYGKFCLNYE